jgi:hypothetical protein
MIIPLPEKVVVSCIMLWQAVAAYHNWNELAGLMLDIKISPGTLTLWPRKLEGEKHLDRLVLYTLKGRSSKASDTQKLGES